MIHFTVRTKIARSPTEVFGYITDPAKLATWQTNTISAVADDDRPFGLARACAKSTAPPWTETRLAEYIEASDAPELEPAETPSGHFAPASYEKSEWLSGEDENNQISGPGA